jgi:hypothetical protein
LSATIIVRGKVLRGKKRMRERKTWRKECKSNKAVQRRDGHK